MNVLIVGAGSMGRALATRLRSGDCSLRITDRDYAKASDLAMSVGAEAIALSTGPGAAEVVILALPYPAERELAAAWSAALPGKVLVDIVNPVDFATMDRLVVPAGTSAAEETAAAAPGARVVKAFNTTFAGTLVDGAVAGIPLDVFIAGDDENACAIVAEVVSEAGMRPLVVGALRHARELEGFQLLHMKLQPALKTEFSSALKILDPAPGH